MFCNMSLLLRPSLVGFLVGQPFSAVLIHMFLLATIMTFDGLLISGDILATTLSYLISPFSFAL
jgi:hypothetical protein